MRKRVPLFPLVVLLLAAQARAGDVSVRLDTGAGFSLRDASGSVERLRVDEATGNVSRNGMLFIHTSGPLGVGNLFMGPNAGNMTTGHPDYGGFNSAFGTQAMQFAGTGDRNSAFGVSALRFNTSGPFNSAFGNYALAQNTSGFENSAFGSNALGSNTTGTRNAAFGAHALTYQTTGSYNSAFGAAALVNGAASDNSAFGGRAMSSTTSGTANAAFGRDALRSNSTGNENNAFGFNALRSSTSLSGSNAFGSRALEANTGSGNSAFGHHALRANTSGFGSSGFGNSALSQSTGSGNTGVGYASLANTTNGQNNTALGFGAGVFQTSGSNNIYLANSGGSGESGQIRIGTNGAHTQAHVAGVHGSTSGGGVAVLVNASGTLGTTTSSARFKEDVREMADASDVVMKLRPVVFRYREDTVGVEAAKTTHYGLIAEEVAEVAPELVAPDLEGRPYSVKYHELPALLLNELQEQERTIAEQRALIAALAQRVARLEAR